MSAATPYLYHVHPGSVLVPDDRQRTTLTGIDELCASITQVGQLQPILITGAVDGPTLVAGGRRLEACRRLGLLVTAMYVEDMDPETRELAELEENVKREELPWLDRANAIRKATLLLKGRDVTLLADVAARLSISETVLKRNLSIAKEFAVNPTNKIFELAGVDTAYNELARQTERKADNEMEQVNRAVPKPVTTMSGAPGIVPAFGTTVQPVAPMPPAANPILNEDFTTWAPAYHGPRFNLIHCDFPYGVNATAGGQISAALDARESYDDAEDIYWKLLDVLCEHGPRFIADSAHMIFWFSMKHYTQTVLRLRGVEWAVSPHPLVWLKSDNAGILQDYNRTYRNIYETALFCTRGDRKLVRAKSNAIAHPRGSQLAHISEKPRAVLRHFLEGITDGNSFAFDPTAGSGNALIEATALGAELVLGLELDPVVAADTNVRYIASLGA